MDAGWKRDVVRLALSASERRGSSAVVADLACGTGDLAFALSSEGRFALGLDASGEMLRRAASRARTVNGAGPRLAAADMSALPLPDGSVDVVTVGYGLRNASRLDTTLDEIARILRPGGHLVALDFYKPLSVLWRRLFLGYLAVAGNAYGWAWHREPAAYGYIPRSIARFVTASELSIELVRRGFVVYHERRHLLGGICVHAAVLRGSGSTRSRLA
jgi:demethylmenaquinone methyltransferase/2-methoxy-6-polyprenyl-1,4-benzoquinol methylase